MSGALPRVCPVLATGLGGPFGEVLAIRIIKGWFISARHFWKLLRQKGVQPLYTLCAGVVLFNLHQLGEMMKISEGI